MCIYSNEKNKAILLRLFLKKRIIVHFWNNSYVCFLLEFIMDTFRLPEYI